MIKIKANLNLSKLIWHLILHSFLFLILRNLIFIQKALKKLSKNTRQPVRLLKGQKRNLLMTDYWSRGIMTEAVRQICAAAFSELDIVRITGLVYAPNTASIRVLEKNGFVCEGIQRNAVYKDDKIYDLCLFGKLK